MARRGAKAAKRAFLIPISAAVAAAISACGGQSTETVTTTHEVTRTETVPAPEKKHAGPTPLEEAERELAAEEREEETEEELAEEEAIEAEEAEGELEAVPSEPEYAPESHYSHSSHSSHSSHVSSYGGGGGHYSHSSHSSHSSHVSGG